MGLKVEGLRFGVRALPHRVPLVLAPAPTSLYCAAADATNMGGEESDRASDSESNQASIMGASSSSRCSPRETRHSLSPITCSVSSLRSATMPELAPEGTALAAASTSLQFGEAGSRINRQEGAAVTDDLGVNNNTCFVWCLGSGWMGDSDSDDFAVPKKRGVRKCQASSSRATEPRRLGLGARGAETEHFRFCSCPWVLVLDISHLRRVTRLPRIGSGRLDVPSTSAAASWAAFLSASASPRASTTGESVPAPPGSLRVSSQLGSREAASLSLGTLLSARLAPPSLGPLLSARLASPSSCPPRDEPPEAVDLSLPAPPARPLPTPPLDDASSQMPLSLVSCPVFDAPPPPPAVPWCGCSHVEPTFGLQAVASLSRDVRTSRAALGTSHNSFRDRRAPFPAVCTPRCVHGNKTGQRAVGRTADSKRGVCVFQQRIVHSTSAFHGCLRP